MSSSSNCLPVVWTELRSSQHESNHVVFYHGSYFYYYNNYYIFFLIFLLYNVCSEEIPGYFPITVMSLEKSFWNIAGYTSPNTQYFCVENQ